MYTLFWVAFVISIVLGLSNLILGFLTINRVHQTKLGICISLFIYNAMQAYVLWYGIHAIKWVNR